LYDVVLIYIIDRLVLYIDETILSWSIIQIVYLRTTKYTHLSLKLFLFWRDNIKIDVRMKA